MAEKDGIEPPCSPSKGDVLPLNDFPEVNGWGRGNRTPDLSLPKRTPNLSAMPQLGWSAGIEPVYAAVTVRPASIADRPKLKRSGADKNDGATTTNVVAPSIRHRNHGRCGGWMEAPAGVEPTTVRLQGDCSAAIELRSRFVVPSLSMSGILAQQP